MKFWYKDSIISWLLTPLSYLYAVILIIRKYCYRYSIFKSYSAKIPIIIVGNISVGGTGKTPMVIWLNNYLQQQGFRTAIISRGYGSKSKTYPLLINKDSPYQISGDEPLLLAQHTTVPVVIGANRRASIEFLKKTYNPDIIISDDGLQHYALNRTFELVMVDAKRIFGNKKLLPAGPLREPISRLNSVDMIVYNGTNNNNSGSFPSVKMLLQPDSFINLKTGSKLSIDKFKNIYKNKSCTAITGIGNPERFFITLENIGIRCKETKAYPDHYSYIEQDINSLSIDNNSILLMTEKDAVKIKPFAKANYWYLTINALFTQEDTDKLLNAIKAKIK